MEEIDPRIVKAFDKAFAARPQLHFKQPRKKHEFKGAEDLTPDKQIAYRILRRAGLKRYEARMAACSDIEVALLRPVQIRLYLSLIRKGMHKKSAKRLAERDA
jgi:hypothetical protein